MAKQSKSNVGGNDVLDGEEAQSGDLRKAARMLAVKLSIPRREAARMLNGELASSPSQGVTVHAD